MDAYKAIITKRDRREYDQRPIPEESLHRILQAGRMAGSSSNSQPLRFIVLREQASKNALLPFGRGTKPIETAPLTVVLCIQKGARDLDAGRAMQNMMIAAWAEGIVNCPVGIQQKEEASRALGLPDDLEVSICTTFGYPAEGSPSSRGQTRMPLEEMVHYERW